tara:strand:- start:1131 stop:2117 length:987 start_codon:yes stop_codon:yes gene_type:complete
MLGTTFYNESIRKSLVAFGTLFNGITIKRAGSGTTIQSVSVPLAYAPRARFVQILQQTTANNVAEVQGGLPRMSFEWTGLTYDSTRKLNTMQKTAVTYKTLTFASAPNLFTTGEKVTGGTSSTTAYVVDQPSSTTIRVRDASGSFTNSETITGASSNTTGTLASASADVSNANKVLYFWQRVPYNMDVALAIACDTTEDGLKIIEQILPYFTPELTVSINDVQKHDMPVVLTDVSQMDEWEGGAINERRLITWTLNFQLKTYLYGPAKESNIVKEAITQLYTKNVFSGLDDTQIAMTTANIRTVQVPNPTTADADDSYTVTETQTDNI